VVVNSVQCEADTCSVAAVSTAAAFVVTVLAGGFRGGRFGDRHHRFNNDVIFFDDSGFPGWWVWGYPYGYYGPYRYPYDYYRYGGYGY
jgi:hypothetical protein